MELSSVRKDGSLRPSFGEGGRVVLPDENEDGVLARDSFGRIFVLAVDDEFGSAHRRLLRLERDGSVDRRFGKKGSVALPYGDRALAIGDRGRALLARTSGVNEHRLVLERRRRDGTIDRRFGAEGRTAAQFPGRIEPQQILVGGSGRILVAGTFYAGNRFGVGLARFLGR
jgi:hypothetical protein